MAISRVLPGDDKKSRIRWRGVEREGRDMPPSGVFALTSTALAWLSRVARRRVDRAGSLAMGVGGEGQQSSSDSKAHVDLGICRLSINVYTVHRCILSVRMCLCVMIMTAGTHAGHEVVTMHQSM